MLYIIHINIGVIRKTNNHLYLYSIWISYFFPSIFEINNLFYFSMSSMGFNSMACLQSASTMNSSSIMPSVTSISSSLSSSSSPYSTPAPSHYNMYKDYKESTYPGMSSSIASLRLKAKHHQSGFSSYSPQPPLSPRSLSACQYTGAPDRPII